MKRNATVWICALLTLSSVIAFPAGDAAADATATEPSADVPVAPRAVTVIYNVYDLQNMSKNMSGNYVLANDIDASGTFGWNDAKGFAPVGRTSGSSFKGILDGKGFKISDLYINRYDEEYIGLVGNSFAPAKITNVNMINVNITGLGHVGALVGNLFGTLSNCTSSGSVTGDHYVGGLVGNCTTFANISGCSSTVSVSDFDLSSGYSVGGLVGRGSGTINNSFTNGSVNSGAVMTGGLVGFANWANISNCHNAGPVNGSNTVGGLVGFCTSGTMYCSYSTGPVRGLATFGGLIGTLMYSPTFTECYYDMETSGTNKSAGGVGKTTAEMMKKSTFNKWDFADTWGILETKTYPFLRRCFTFPDITGVDVPSTKEDAVYSAHYDASRFRYPMTNDSVVWSLDTNATGWLAFNHVSGELSGTPGNADIGSYRVHLCVTDIFGNNAWRNFTLIVENVPPVFTRAPVSAIISLNQGEACSFDFNCDDEGLAGTSYRLVSAPDWLAIDAASGKLSGRPGNDDVGRLAIMLSADDGWGGRTDYGFEIVVADVNDPPEITTHDVLTATLGVPYRVAYQATDIDPEDTTFMWGLATNATWLSMHSATGVLSGTPGASDVGSRDVNITVVDGRGGRDSREFVLTVLKTNAPPAITTAAIPSATKGVQYRFSLTAADPDAGDVLAWSLNTAATWLAIDANTGALSGTPGDSNVGSFEVNVTVKDHAGASDSIAYTLRVLTVNGPPVWVSAPQDMSTTEGQRFLFTMQANDPDGDPVQCRVSSQPACGISIDLALGELGWQSPAVGEYAVNVSGTAGQFTIYHAFVLTVKGFVTNNPPMIQAVANATAKVGQAFSLKLDGSDPDSWDAVNLTFRLVSGPAGMVVSAEGSILWVPTKEQVGKQSVTVGLSDGKRSTTAAFVITVNPATASDPSGIPTGASSAWMVLIFVICIAYRRLRHL